MTVPPRSRPKHRRRTPRELAALGILLALGAIVVWQILQTANASLQAMPTRQAEATLAPVAGQVNLALPISTREETPTQWPTPSPIPTIPCDIAKIPREICGPLHTVLPTPTPIFRCDDPRLIGGQFCVWPTPTPGVESLWE